VGESEGGGGREGGGEVSGNYTLEKYFHYARTCIIVYCIVYFTATHMTVRQPRCKVEASQSWKYDVCGDTLHTDFIVDTRCACCMPSERLLPFHICSAALYFLPITELLSLNYNLTYIPPHCVKYLKYYILNPRITFYLHYNLPNSSLSTNQAIETMSIYRLFIRIITAQSLSILLSISGITSSTLATTCDISVPGFQVRGRASEMA